MEKIINSIFNWVISKRIEQIEHFRKHPHEVQENVFQFLIKQAKETEWGEKFDYAQIKDQDDFQKNVPISTYEDFYPYIERTLKGEQNLLWNTEIKWFSKSSGTTNAKSKFIPISNASLEDCHYKGGKDLLALYVNRYPDTRFVLGKNLAIGGSLQPNPFNPKTYCGDVSAIIMKNLPIWAEYMRTPGIEIALMDKWEDKIEQMAQITAKENVTNIAGVPTWTLVLLQRILEITGKETIREVWPNLEFFGHGAVAFGPYRETFKTIFGSDEVRYMEIYNASEGFFGLQDTNEPDEMLLMLDYGVFYEFIPMSEFGKENPKVLSLYEVEANVNYALVISTNAGLWRYLIGDTVKFTSTSPYRIKITGRTKHFINAFGEEVVIENAEKAIVTACNATNASITNFTVAPIYLEKGKRGGHEWLIEFEKEPNNLELFTFTLDDTLREINSDYDAKRYQDIALVKPVIKPIPKGTFYNWMKKRGKLGGQHKVPRLANNREYVEDILEMVAQ